MINNSLRFWRKARGCSQGRLGKQVGLDQTAISLIEVGEREPSTEVWQQFSDFLKVPLDALFAEPPIQGGGSDDVIIERLTENPGGEDEPAGRAKTKRKVQKGFGRVVFMSPSQAKVGMQLQQTIMNSEKQWDGVRVWVELPCDDDRQSILETKAEAVAYCRAFLDEETKRILQEETDRFNAYTMGKVDGNEKSGVSQDPQRDPEGVPQSFPPGDGQN